MKYLIKLMMSVCIWPFLILGGLIAVARVIFTMTFLLAWEKGYDWHIQILYKLNDLMQWVRK